MDMKKTVQITLYNQEKEEKRILLKLSSVGYGDEADQYCYSISQSIPLRDLMLDFIKCVGVTFYYQDEPILPTFSAEFLEMKDGDTALKGETLDRQPQLNPLLLLCLWLSMGKNQLFRNCVSCCCIDMRKTADDLGLEDGDVIYVYMWQYE
ncbi:hypothetical protein J1N35_036890 [Gossypium stocksii]|uniref:Rad60/SUMO-like domain-containing protein n=1 Tax=Gossypium stocksii TaxID=47602 RepID=A0A9D3UJ56_9ROSI|nr:hypothetical protein J1N35_036890 [Gossypium stocksii]